MKRVLIVICTVALFAAVGYVNAAERNYGCAAAADSTAMRENAHGITIWWYCFDERTRVWMPNIAIATTEEFAAMNAALDRPFDQLESAFPAIVSPNPLDVRNAVAVKSVAHDLNTPASKAIWGPWQAEIIRNTPKGPAK